MWFDPNVQTSSLTYHFPLVVNIVNIKKCLLKISTRISRADNLPTLSQTKVGLKTFCLELAAFDPPWERWPGDFMRWGTQHDSDPVTSGWMVAIVVASSSSQISWRTLIQTYPNWNWKWALYFWPVSAMVFWACTSRTVVSHDKNPRESKGTGHGNSAVFIGGLSGCPCLQAGLVQTKSSKTKTTVLTRVIMVKICKKNINPKQTDGLRLKNANVDQFCGRWYTFSTYTDILTILMAPSPAVLPM
jgi:hypothetical protein